VTRNVALMARAPKQRSRQRVEGISLTEEELRQLMRAAAEHRFFPIYWLTAMTGMRRNEVLGLKWTDIDLKKRRIHLNRGLVAVGYEVHQTRGKTKTAGLAAMGIANEEGWVFTDGDGNTIHPHAVYESFKRIVRNAGVPEMRFHDLRHTHGSLLLKEGIPVKLVSERSGTPTSPTRCRFTSTSCPACRPTLPPPPSALANLARPRSSKGPKPNRLRRPSSALPPRSRPRTTRGTPGNNRRKAA